MSQLGYYGKTPHRGDFVRFNLPQTFVNTWDDWLQTAIAQSESAFAADWASIYDNAPVYRFLLSAGIAGGTAWAGCMSAQRDKVGRRFPFCIAMSLPEYPAPASAIVGLNDWYGRIEQLSRRIHQKDYSFDELQPALESIVNDLDLQSIQTETSDNSFSNSNPDSLLITLNTGNALLSAQNTLSILSCVLESTVGEYSLWWMANEPQASTVLSAGLPTGAAASALFSRQWDNTGASVLSAVSTASMKDEPATGSDTVDTTDTVNTGNTGNTIVPAVAISADDTQPIPDNPFADSQFAESETDSGQDPTELPTINAKQRALAPSPLSGQQSAAQSTENPADQSKPSADDWAALADFESVDTDEDPVVPTVEPLELEEDNEDAPPWES